MVKSFNKTHEENVFKIITTIYKNLTGDIIINGKNQLSSVLELPETFTLSSPVHLRAGRVFNEGK